MDSEKLVGIARSFTDFCYSCCLSHLAVDKEYQRRGIGLELVQRVLIAIGEALALVLLSAPEAIEFYAKLGMEQLQAGWMVRRVE